MNIFRPIAPERFQPKPDLARRLREAAPKTTAEGQRAIAPYGSAGFFANKRMVEADAKPSGAALPAEFAEPVEAVAAATERAVGWWITSEDGALMRWWGGAWSLGTCTTAHPRYLPGCLEEMKNFPLPAGLQAAVNAIRLATPEEIGEPVAEANPWQAWSGKHPGHMPCRSDTKIDVKLRDGRVQTEMAGMWIFGWYDTGDEADITHWRPAQGVQA